MARHFSFIFWGLLLAFLDFRIGEFDVLPDGLGYLLVAAGCGGLALSRQFAVARLLCFVLAGLWLLEPAVPRNDQWILDVVTTVAHCGMIWELLGGVREFALAMHRPDLAQRAANRRQLYVVVFGLMTLLPQTLRRDSAAVPMVVIIAVIGAVLAMLILHLIYRVRIEVAK